MDVFGGSVVAGQNVSTPMSQSICGWGPPGVLRPAATQRGANRESFRLGSTAAGTTAWTQGSFAAGEGAPLKGGISVFDRCKTSGFLMVSVSQVEVFLEMHIAVNIMFSCVCFDETVFPKATMKIFLRMLGCENDQCLQALDGLILNLHR